MGRPRKHYEVVQIPETDFKLVMHELEVNGLTPYMVAQYLGCSVAAAANWAEGGEPRFHLGASLLALHKQVCG
jgi:hypothetical protein